MPTRIRRAEFLPWSRIGAECGSGSFSLINPQAVTVPGPDAAVSGDALAAALPGAKTDASAAVDGGAAGVLIPGLPIDELLVVPGVLGLAVVPPSGGDPRVIGVCVLLRIRLARNVLGHSPGHGCTVSRRARAGRTAVPGCLIDLNPAYNQRRTRAR